MSYHVIRENKYRVAALSSINASFQSSSPALEFLKNQYDNSKNQSSCKGLMALFDRFAEMGPTGLSTSNIHEANKSESILEFIKGDLRILFFMVGNTAFLTNGYVKKSQKAPTSEISKAVTLKELYKNDIK